MTLRTVGPVEQYAAGLRAAEAYLDLLSIPTGSRADDLHATARAVQLAHGEEGGRAFFRRIQRALEVAAEQATHDGR